MTKEYQIVTKKFTSGEIIKQTGLGKIITTFPEIGIIGIGEEDPNPPRIEE